MQDGNREKGEHVHQIGRNPKHVPKDYPKVKHVCTLNNVTVYAPYLKRIYGAYTVTLFERKREHTCFEALLHVLEGQHVAFSSWHVFSRAGFACFWVVVCLEDSPRRLWVRPSGGNQATKGNTTLNGPDSWVSGDFKLYSRIL
jgi:hypothetical protein